MKKLATGFLAVAMGLASVSAMADDYDHCSITDNDYNTYQVFSAYTKDGTRHTLLCNMVKEEKIIYMEGTLGDDENYGEIEAWYMLSYKNISTTEKGKEHTVSVYHGTEVFTFGREADGQYFLTTENNRGEKYYALERDGLTDGIPAFIKSIKK